MVEHQQAQHVLLLQQHALLPRLLAHQLQLLSCPLPPLPSHLPLQLLLAQPKFAGVSVEVTAGVALRDVKPHGHAQK